MGINVVDDLSTNYNKNIDTSDFNNTFNSIDDMYSLSQDMKNDTLDNDISGDDEAWESMTKGSYSATRNVRSTFGVIGNIANDLSDIFNLPPYLTVFFMTAITVSVVFGAIYLFMRFRP